MKHTKLLPRILHLKEVWMRFTSIIIGIHIPANKYSPPQVGNNTEALHKMPPKHNLKDNFITSYNGILIRATKSI